MSPRGAPFSCLALLLPGFVAASDPLLAWTHLGAARGDFGTAWSGRDFRIWKGMPYGLSTAGERRFRPPLPATSWDGTLNATEFGPTCPQVADMRSGGGSFSEDCLRLSVWAPLKPAERLRPVLLNFCGGAYKYGAMSFPGLDGGEIVTSRDVIYVAPNFRVGITGFLALQELMDEDRAQRTTGNYGMQDQRLALQWVKDNIAAFGGDPERITIGGVSAGGGNVVGHATSLQTPVGLFYAVSPESPMPIWHPLETAIDHGHKFVKDLGCDTAKDIVSCMRQIPIDELQGYDNNNSILHFPAIDGFEWDKQPIDMALRFTGPAYVGHTTNEGTIFTMAFGNVARWQYYALVGALFNIHAYHVYNMYPVSKYLDEYGDGAAYVAFSDLVGDILFTCPTRRFANAAAQEHDTFYWVFGQAPPCEVMYGMNVTKEGLKNLGPYHGITIPYFEGNNNTGGDPACLREGELAPFWNATHNYFVNFLAHGNPNGVSTPDKSLPGFPRYLANGEGLRKMLRLQLADDADFKEPLCDYWDSVGLEAMFEKLLWWQDTLFSLMKYFQGNGLFFQSAEVMQPETPLAIGDLDEANFFLILKEAAALRAEYEARVQRRAGSASSAQVVDTIVV